MAFATRTDLLARSNARRLFQLAVPADMAMPPEDALRVAIAGGDLTIYDDADQLTLAAALAAIDDALADADSLMLSYGIPATVQTTLLARLASTIALYYLQGAERMTKEVQQAYDAAVAMLNKHSTGQLNLIPAAPTDPVPSADVVTIESRPGRYTYSIEDEVGL
jgi:phage gp36-like protein